MAKIRVLRLLEYVYDNQARADEDQARWQTPAAGSFIASGMMIRSAIITDLNFGGDEAENQDEYNRRIRRGKARCPCSLGPEPHSYGWHDVED
jgi:hypothetical protein